MRVERIVETVPDASNPLGKVTHVIERYHYSKAEIAIMKSRQAFAEASAAAATLLQASLTSPDIAKSAEGTTATCSALAKALIWKIAYLTVKPLEKNYFFDLSQPETVDVERGAHEQPGAAPVPHLDEERIKKLPNLAPTAPATIYDGVSKVLTDEGFEQGETDDEIEHFHHRDAGHEVMVHESGEWAMKSGWDGQITAGETVDDLQVALAEIA
jgi:hypothetical protein